MIDLDFPAQEDLGINSLEFTTILVVIVKWNSRI